MIKTGYAGLVAVLLAFALLVTPPFGALSLVLVWLTCDSWPRFCNVMDGPRSVITYGVLWAFVAIAVLGLAGQIRRERSR